MSPHYIDFDVYEFEWDCNELKIAASGRGIHIEEIEEIFFNDPHYQRSRPGQDEEIRYSAIGQTYEGRFLTVIYTLRERAVRVITAYESTNSQIRLYQSQKRWR